jgi:pSer/pThr/pTyr-binding forkhead associated (FHA) protein
MAAITLQVLDGADRGRVFANLATPVTIGREEGNTVQLNDERVSRYHLKIQEDHDKVVLTDLESTNGTKVNGEEVQIRILRAGDMISVGRSVLLFGSREQIARRLRELGGDGAAAAPPNVTISPEEAASSANAAAVDFDLDLKHSPDARKALQQSPPPELPQRLSPGQAAQLSEVLEYLHLRIRTLLASVRAGEEAEQVTLDYSRWQSLLDLQTRLANYLKQIAEPRSQEF